MQMSIILFVVSGFLLGLSLQGGMFLFLIPFAGVAGALGYMNLPRVPGGKTASLPVVSSAVRATGVSPAVTPELKNSFGDSDADYNEPGSTLRVNQVWARADADVKKAFGDMLEGLKRIVPNVHTLVVFSPLGSMKEWGIRAYACASPEAKIATDVKITENTGLISQLFRLDVNRLLEGDLSGGKSLLYYIDNPMIKSLVAVPMLDRGKNRVGAVVMDSLYPNAFNQQTAQGVVDGEATLIVQMPIILTLLQYSAYQAEAQMHTHLQVTKMAVIIFRKLQHFLPETTTQEQLEIILHLNMPKTTAVQMAVQVLMQTDGISLATQSFIIFGS